MAWSPGSLDCKSLTARRPRPAAGFEPCPATPAPHASRHDSGRVAEWFMAPVLKTGVGESSPWVRIPPLPPFLPYQEPIGAGFHCRSPVWSGTRAINESAPPTEVLAPSSSHTAWSLPDRKTFRAVVWRGSSGANRSKRRRRPGTDGSQRWRPRAAVAQDSAPPRQPSPAGSNRRPGPWRGVPARVQSRCGPGGRA